MNHKLLLFMAPLHRGSQLFSQMCSGGRISERLLFYERTNMTSDNSCPQKLTVSDAIAQSGPGAASSLFIAPWWQKLSGDHQQAFVFKSREIVHH